jgi:hypothetical protein
MRLAFAIVLYRIVILSEAKNVLNGRLAFLRTIQIGARSKENF